MESVNYYLKRYFNKVSNVYGEEVAAESALEEYDMAESLSYYDSTFNNINGLDIMKEMIISTIEHKENDKYYYQYISKMLKKNSIEELIYDITYNIVLKREVVKNYIYNMNRKSNPISNEEKSLIDLVYDYNIKEKEMVLCK